MVKSPSRPNVERILQDIYGSLVEDVSFRSCLQVVGEAFGSHVTAVQSEELRLRASRIDVIGEVQGVEFLRLAQEYAGRWSGQNLWIQRGIGKLLERGYGDGDEVVSQYELLNSEYYRYFLKPVDVRYGMGISLQLAGASSLAVLSLNRTAKAAPFTASDFAVAEALRPHLVNAYAISQRIARLHDEVMSLRASFDHAPLGMLVLDAEARVVEQNHEASRLLSSATGIALTSRRGLRLCDPICQVKFRSAVARLSDASRDPFPESIRVLAKDRDRNDSGHVLHLCAFPASTMMAGGSPSRVIAFICELSLHSKNEFAARVLRMTLDLTSAEAAVVMSLRGQQDPLHVALDLGLAISTVRTHLKHAFRKTGTRRQSELLRLVDRLLSAVTH